MTSLRILVICKHTLTVALFYHIHSAHSTLHVIGWDGLEGSGGLESLGGDSSSLQFEFENEKSSSRKFEFESGSLQFLPPTPTQTSN